MVVVWSLRDTSSEATNKISFEETSEAVLVNPSGRMLRFRRKHFFEINSLILPSALRLISPKFKQSCFLRKRKINHGWRSQALLIFF